MEEYLDNKIKELEVLLDKDALSSYGGGLLDAYKDVKKQLTLNVVSQQRELLKAFLNDLDDRYEKAGTVDLIIDEYLSSL